MAHLPQYLPFYLVDHPEISSVSASRIGSTVARLGGTIVANGLPVKYWFEYGEIKGYGSKTAITTGMEGTATVTAHLTGLKPKTKYHFRLVAENEEGIAEGEDATFTTEFPIRIAVAREFPSTELAWRILDPKTGTTIARLAEDAHRPEDVISGITKSSQMSGGPKEAAGSLARDPRVAYPDIALLNDVIIELPGGESVWDGRIERPDKSDGLDRTAIELAAAGHQNAFEDRTALRIGFINSDLSAWGSPSTERLSNLQKATYELVAEVVNGWRGSGEEGPGIIMNFANATEQAGSIPLGEAVFYGGGIIIGALLYDFVDVDGLGAAALGAQTIAQLWSDDVASATANGTDHKGITAREQRVESPSLNAKYAAFDSAFVGAKYEGALKNLHNWAHPTILGDQGIRLQGTWPNVGYTAKQMLSWMIPEFSYLEVRDEDLEDDEFLISQAWFSDPGSLATIVKELTKYGPFDWFVKGKRFHFRKPGTYGHKWKAYAGPSELKETGEFAQRVWDRIVVAYQDVSGRTISVGYPGSGADIEYASLQITDPDNPAVRADRKREDLLVLNGIGSTEAALRAGEQFLEDASQVSHAGEALLKGFIQDDKSIFRPVSQIEAGEWIEFPDAGSGGAGYRKITQCDYNHDNREAVVALDAPPEKTQALLERLDAVLVRLGVS